MRHPPGSRRMRAKTEPTRALHAAHERAQHLGHHDRAVRLLVVLQDRDDRPRQRKPLKPPIEICGAQESVAGQKLPVCEPGLVCFEGQRGVVRIVSARWGETASAKRGSRPVEAKRRIAAPLAIA